jgi:Zn-dependent protease
LIKYFKEEGIKPEIHKIYKKKYLLEEMVNGKEIAHIIIVTIITAFAIALTKNLVLDLGFFLYALLGVFILLLVNMFVKKTIAYLLEAEIEIKIWEIKRFGFKTGDYFKKAFPLGAIIPLISKIFFLGLNGFVWMASLVFDVKAKSYRAAKRHGMYSFSEMTEEHIGRIAASGIFVHLILAFIFYFIGGEFGTLFAKLNIWFAFFNMIPISDLDGNKIFFGNLVLWSFLAIVTLIGLGYTFFLI